MDIFVSLITNYFLQMLFTLGIIVMFGVTIAFCNSMIYRNLGRKSRTFCIATGFIGTPIHEVAHALACLIFCHKILEIKLFIPNSTDGTLGYVSHSYNKKNLYQRVGNFFIGIAPIIVGAGVLALLLYLLLPEMFSDVTREIRSIDFLDNIGESFKGICETFVVLFSYIGSWQWWLFLFLGSFIALHMTLSKADIEGAISGLLLFFAIIFVLDMILVFASKKALIAVTSAAVYCGTLLLFFFCLFAIIALVLFIVTKVFSKIGK